jgi:hypothetical protein
MDDEQADDVCRRFRRNRYFSGPSDPLDRRNLQCTAQMRYGEYQKLFHSAHASPPSVLSAFLSPFS